MDTPQSAGWGGGGGGGGVIDSWFERVKLMVAFKNTGMDKLVVSDMKN